MVVFGEDVMNQVELQPWLVDAVYVHRPLPSVARDSDGHITEGQLDSGESHAVRDRGCRGDGLAMSATNCARDRIRRHHEPDPSPPDQPVWLELRQPE